MPKSVTVSAPKRVTLRKHVVQVNVQYGSKNGAKGEWSLNVSNRTGRGTPEQEVLETFAWHYFEGLATPAQFRKIKKWLRQHGLYENDYDFVAVAVKQLNDGMKEKIERWKNE